MAKERMTLEEALVPVEEQPYEVPENWVWVRFQSICDVRDGTHDSPQYVDSGYPLITSKNLKEGQIDFENVKFISKKDLDQINLRSKAEKGDILFAMIGTIGNPVIVNEDSESKYAIKNVALFKPYDKANSKFILSYLNSPTYMELVKKDLKGSTQKFIPLGKLRESLVVMPPINEQKRLMRKIDNMLLKLREAKVLIQEAKETFELRRASILHKAFTGGLTEKWRNEIREVIKEDSNFSSNNTIFELPVGWKWLKLKDACNKITDGSHFSPKVSEDGFPYITVKDIDSREIDFENCKKISKEDYEILKNNNCKPMKGDVLFSKDGTVGKTVLVNFEKEFVVLSSLAIIRPNPQIITPEYLELCLRSPEVIKQALNSKTGTAIKRVILKNLSNILIPIPKIREQNEIIKCVYKLVTIEQEAQNLIDLEEQIDLIEKSILSKAFRGELGTNDPGDEPAIELLKRVLEEKGK